MPEILKTSYQWRSYLSRDRLRILIYHSISEHRQDPFAVSPKTFEEQMVWLLKSGFSVISLQQAADDLRAKNPLRRKVVLTFDDGYQDFLDEAVPILTKHHLPATLFVAFGKLGKLSDWCRYEKARRHLDWHALRKIKEIGFDIGSHSMNHPDLTSLDEQCLLNELSESLHLLKSEIGATFVPFAYPWGRFSEREIKAVQKVGYSCALIADGQWGNGYETNLFALKRYPCFAAISQQFSG